jgi:CheY-like chemotaxis protein
LTTQLLAFARKQIIDPKILDLNQTLENMIPMMQRLMGEDIELNWIPGLSIDPVKIDPSQINQILANLCVNARDAITDVGKISIKTSNIILDRQFALDNAGAVPGKYVMLLFKDNGKGMDQITLARLFEPFYTTKGIGKGTGLGLAMIYGIVKQNRGYINVLSTLGKGTEFKIYFPAASTEETKKVSQTGPGDNKAIAHGTETILLVEDEPPVLRMTKIMLERRGYHVITADGPDSAIELIQTKGSQIDLLMTDIIMPGMNGKDLADILVIFNPALKCLFMSGYTADIIANKGVLQKGVEFIQKPFSLFQLCSKVRKVLDRNI